jgi:hypothetical protein
VDPFKALEVGRSSDDFAWVPFPLLSFPVLKDGRFPEYLDPFPQFPLPFPHLPCPVLLDFEFSFPVAFFSVLVEPICFDPFPKLSFPFEVDGISPFPLLADFKSLLPDTLIAEVWLFIKPICFDPFPRLSPPFPLEVDDFSPFPQFPFPTLLFKLLLWFFVEPVCFDLFVDEIFELG